MRVLFVLLAICVVGAAAGSSPASWMARSREGGTVVIATQERACLNVLVDACGARAGLLPAIGQVLEGAFEVTPDLTYRPNLVSRWELTKKPFTVTYHIRPQARWSDGVPVTAQDFVFTYQAFPTGTAFNDPLRLVRRLRAVDSKTLRVTFRSRYPDWRDLFPMVLPRHALTGQDLHSVWRETIDDPKTRRPIGSGPFLVQRLERGRQLTLVRNPRYWGPHKAYLDRLVFRFVSPNDYADALRRRDVDLIAGGAAALQLRRQPTPGIRVTSGPSTAWEHLEVQLGDSGHPALKNKLVRRALAYGLDRKAIAQAVLGELDGESPAAVKVLDSVVFTTDSPSYHPNWSIYRHRPAESRRLLERAGCRRGAERVYSCGGEKLVLRFVTTAGSESRDLQLELVRSQLARIGVEVLPKFVPAPVFFSTVLPRGDFDLALFSWIAGPAGSGSYYIFRCQGENNFTGYCQRLVTRDLLETTRMLDPARRARALNQVDVSLAEDVPVIPLLQLPYLIALRTTVRGVVPNSLAFTWNSEDWWLGR